MITPPSNGCQMPPSVFVTWSCVGAPRSFRAFSSRELYLSRMGPWTGYAVPLAPVICVVLGAALGPVGAAAPGVADDVTDVVAEVVVSPDLVAWLHPAPISANPVIAAEKTAVRFVIARITFPLELDRTSTPTHPNGDAMRISAARQRTITPGHRGRRDRVLRDAAAVKVEVIHHNRFNLIRDNILAPTRVARGGRQHLVNPPRL